MDVPETRYARRPDGVNIGYQSLGSGPPALVWCWEWMSHLDLSWGDPGVAHMFKRLARFCRLVLFDKPGTGVSDPIEHVAMLEERVEDVRVVMDTADIEHAAILGESEAGPVAVLFAATYPSRTDALGWCDRGMEFVIVGGPEPRSYRGRAEIEAGWRDYIGAWEEFSIEAQEYRELDDERVLVPARFHGRGKASGTEVARARGCYLFHLRSGKVVRQVFYWDREQAFADLGLAPEPD
jgi:pimeloyl-ACP methyl ester carboxylesterase